MTLEAVFAELLQGAKSDSERDILLRYWENLPKHEPKDLWLAAGKASGQSRWKEKGLSLVDSVLLTSSHELKIPLWTLDKTLAQVARDSYEPWM